MRILSIETSCDETSLALVKAAGGLGHPRFQIEKHLIASQIEVHRPWGGVVPNLAKREHQKNLPMLFGKLKAKNQKLKAELVTVTAGPGLEPCLWQGIEFAKKLKKEHFPKAKIIPTNHLHGHLYSFLLPKTKNDQFPNYPITNYFPAIQLLVSGGHTILTYMKSLTDYKKLGETRDDAAGEAFDKVARMLNLPYPGGPEIERLAKQGNPNAIPFPRPMLHDKSYDFSFSGLKTAVLYYLKNRNENREDARAGRAEALGALTGSDSSEARAVGVRGSGRAPQERANRGSGRAVRASDVASSFQQAVLDVLTAKALRAAREYGAKTIILSGGVAANSALRKLMRLKAKSHELNFLSADKKFHGDNAAMIAAAGYITSLRKKTCPLKANGALDI